VARSRSGIHQAPANYQRVTANRGQATVSTQRSGGSRQQTSHPQGGGTPQASRAQSVGAQHVHPASPHGGGGDQPHLRLVQGPGNAPTPAGYAQPQSGSAAVAPARRDSQPAQPPAQSYVPRGNPVSKDKGDVDHDIPTHIRKRREQQARDSERATKKQKPTEESASGSQPAVDPRDPRARGYDRGPKHRFRRAGGLSPSEEAEMETPTFLRKPSRSGNFYNKD